MAYRILLSKPILLNDYTLAELSLMEPKPPGPSLNLSPIVCSLDSQIHSFLGLYFSLQHQLAQVEAHRMNKHQDTPFLCFISIAAVAGTVTIG